jgi:hypothetical protein
LPQRSPHLLLHAPGVAYEFRGAREDRAHGRAETFGEIGPTRIVTFSQLIGLYTRFYDRVEKARAIHVRGQPRILREGDRIAARTCSVLNIPFAPSMGEIITPLSVAGLSVNADGDLIAQRPRRHKDRCFLAQQVGDPVAQRQCRRIFVFLLVPNIGAKDGLAHCHRRLGFCSTDRDLRNPASLIQ